MRITTALHLSGIGQIAKLAVDTAYQHTSLKQYFFVLLASYLECFCLCLYLFSSSDDILAKYRKPVAHKSADNIAACPAAVADGVTKSKDKVEDEIPLYDSNNLEMCQAFLDAKKKLRLILSSVDLQVRLPRDIFIVRFLSITFCSM